MCSANVFFIFSLKDFSLCCLVEAVRHIPGRGIQVPARV